MLARKIFRNSNLSEENWKALEKMLEKITEHCLGKGLFNMLEQEMGGKTFVIEWKDVPPDRPGLQGSFYRGTITMYNWESNTLLHEMMHGLQSYFEDEFSQFASTLNREVEARFAQYLYVKSLPEYKEGSKWHNRYMYGSALSRRIAQLDRLVDSRGKLKPDATNDRFFNALNDVYKYGFSINPSYNAKPWDSKRRTPEQMFKVLQQIAKDC